MVYTIVGSGFGLYGYLPAVLANPERRVVLPINYKKKVQSRSELAYASNKIKWVGTQTSALAVAKTVVLAIPPSIQNSIVPHCISFPNISRVILEKPISSNPITAADLLNKLAINGIKFTIAYTLAYLSWQSEIRRSVQSDSKITLTWDFLAHHFQHDVNNWKRSHEHGGGVLRFFGIHVIAMLAMHGYTTVQTISLEGRLKDEPEVWSAIFDGADKPPCHVNINSRSLSPSFSIQGDNCRSLVALPEPFALEKSSNKLDKRVDTLVKIIDNCDINDQPLDMYRWYSLTNSLWEQAENGI